MKKLTQQEIDQIVAFQNQYNENAYSLGTIETEIAVLERELNKLESLKKEKLQNYFDIKQNETNFSTVLIERYGEGEIDLTTWEIIKSS